MKIHIGHIRECSCGRGRQNTLAIITIIGSSSFLLFWKIGREDTVTITTATTIITIIIIAITFHQRRRRRGCGEASHARQLHVAVGITVAGIIRIVIMIPVWIATVAIIRIEWVFQNRDGRGGRGGSTHPTFGWRRIPSFSLIIIENQEDERGFLFLLKELIQER